MFEVLFVASGLDGANSGGIQHSAQLAWDSLHKACSDRGKTAALLSFGDAVSMSTDGAEGCIVRTRSRFELIAKLVLRRWRARRVLFWHMGLTKLLPLLGVGRAQVEVFLHGIEVWKPLGRLSSWRLGRVDRFLSNSEFTWQRFTEYNPRFGEAPHTVVHLGIGAAAAPGNAPPADPPAALMLGRLMSTEAYKGHQETIAAWPRVRASVPGATLWIVGDGDLRPRLERMAAENHCRDSVVFWGRVSEEKKEELLQRCRCLALPSRGEGFGLVYLEAMRLGRPCLVSRYDAGREVVNPPEAGLAVDPNNRADLVDALTRLLQSGTDWDDWSLAGRRRYEARFTAADFQARLLDAVWRNGSRARQAPLGRPVGN